MMTEWCNVRTYRQRAVHPVMIRIEKDAGHGAGTPTEKIIDQYADLFAFAMANMGSPDDRVVPAHSFNKFSSGRLNLSADIPCKTHPSSHI